MDMYCFTSASYRICDSHGVCTHLEKVVLIIMFMFSFFFKKNISHFYSLYLYIMQRIRPIRVHNFFFFCGP